MVSFGHIKDHGSFSDFLKLLFKEVKVEKNSAQEGYITVILIPHPDILINGKHWDKFELASEPSVYKTDEWYERDDLYEELNYNTEFSIKYKDRVYPIGQGHCRSYGIILATVGDGGDDCTYALEEIQDFFAVVKELHEAGRLESDTISMTENCCTRVLCHVCP